jgi:hypothetical protein
MGARLFLLGFFFFFGLNFRFSVGFTVGFAMGFEAEAASVVSAEHEQEKTSDQFQRRTTGVSFNTCQRDLFWPYLDECPKTFGWGLQFRKSEVSLPEMSIPGASRQGVLGSGLRFAATGGLRFSSSRHLHLEIGGHQLAAEPLHQTTVATVGMAQFDWKATSDWDLSLAESRDLIYGELKLPAAFSEALTAWTSRVQSLYRLGETWRFPIRGTVRNYSDDNSSWEYDLSVLYGISPGVPWIWVGAGFNQLSYQDQKSNYWTPKKITSDGPRLEWDIPLYGKFAFSGAANFNHIAEQDSAGAEGLVAVAGLKYGPREGFNIKLQFFNIQTTQLGKSWSSDTVSLTINN